MKNLIIIILSFFLVSCSIFKKRYEFSDPRIPTKEDFDTISLKSYKLLKIDTLTYKYNDILYVERNDSIYKIGTKRENIENCEKMNIGETYDLKLKGIRSKFLPYGVVSGAMGFNKESIYFEKDSGVIWDIYITPYIRGICYIKD